MNLHTLTLLLLGLIIGQGTILLMWYIFTYTPPPPDKDASREDMGFGGDDK